MSITLDGIHLYVGDLMYLKTVLFSYHCTHISSLVKSIIQFM